MNCEADKPAPTIKAAYIPQTLCQWMKVIEDTNKGIIARDFTRTVTFSFSDVFFMHGLWEEKYDPGLTSKWYEYYKEREIVEAYDRSQAEGDELKAFYQPIDLPEESERYRLTKRKATALRKEILVFYQQIAKIRKSTTKKNLGQNPATIEALNSLVLNFEKLNRPNFLQTLHIMFMGETTPILRALRIRAICDPLTEDILNLFYRTTSKKSGAPRDATVKYMQKLINLGAINLTRGKPKKLGI